MTEAAKILADCDFVGGTVMGPGDDLENFQTGLGLMVFVCPHCEAKHLAISTIVEGQRRTVAIHGDDATRFATELMKGIANG